MAKQQVMPAMAKLPPILVVDDEPDDVFILKRLLIKAKLENKLVTFEDSTVAVEYLNVECNRSDSPFIPWIVFTDLQMPGVDGIELAQWIRSKPALADVVILMVTSSEKEVDRQTALSAGASEYLAKYPTVSALSKLLEKYKPQMKTFPDNSTLP